LTLLVDIAWLGIVLTTQSHQLADLATCMQVAVTARWIQVADSGRRIQVPDSTTWINHLVQPPFSEWFWRRSFKRHAERYLYKLSVNLFLWIVFCILFSIEKLSPREIDHLVQPPGSATCIQPPDSATWTRPSVSASRIQPAERRSCSDCRFLLEL